MSSPSRDKSSRRKKVQPEKKEGQPQQQQQQQFHGLQEASSQYIHAYKAWSTGNEEMALSYFERALILLELATTTTTTTSPQSPTSSSSSSISISKTVSSKTYHLLTARTYYWIGWIHLQRTKKILGRHSRTRRRSEQQSLSLPTLPSSSAEAKRAVRALLKSARIRLSLLGSSAEETRQVLNVLTEALPLLHHAASSMSSTTFDVPDDATAATTDTEATTASSSPYTTYASTPHLYIQALQDSLQLETEGDAFLRRHDYTKAFLQYQQAHDVFGDPDHGVLMGKLAFCCNKSIGAIDTSILWYRRALKAFCASVHGPNHPDCELTVQRLMDVLTSPHKNQQKKQKKKRPSKQQQQQQASLLPLATIEWYRAVVRDSVLLELEAEIAETSYSNQLDMAYRKYQGALALEERVLGTNHPVCENLRKQMTRLKMKTTNSASTGNDDTNLDDDDDDEMHTTRNVESRRLLLQLQWKCMKLKEELQGQRTVSEESIRIVSEKKKALKRNKKKTSRRDRLSLEDDYERDLQELHLCKKRSNKAKSLVVLLDSTIGEALMMSGSGGGDVSLSEEQAAIDGIIDDDETPDGEQPSSLLLLELLSSSNNGTNHQIRWFEIQCKILQDIAQVHFGTVDQLRSLAGVTEYILVQSQLLVERKFRKVDKWNKECLLLKKQKVVVQEELEAADELATELRSKLSDLYVQMNDLKVNLDDANNEETLRLLKSEYSAIEGQLKAVMNENIPSLKEKEEALFPSIVQAEAALVEAQSRLEHARNERSAIKSRYKTLTNHIRRMRTSRLATEALHREAEEKLSNLRREESSSGGGEGGHHQVGNYAGVVSSSSSSDILLKEAQECVWNLNAGLDRLNVRSKKLKGEEKDSTRRTKAMEETKINLDVSLFKANEGLDSSKAECEAILERFSRLQRRELQLQQQLLLFEDMIHTVSVEAVAEVREEPSISAGAAATSSSNEYGLQDAEKNAIEIQAARVALSARSIELDAAYSQAESRFIDALSQIRNLEKLSADLETNLKETIDTRESLQAKLLVAESNMESRGIHNPNTNRTGESTFETTNRLMSEVLADVSADFSDSSMTEDMSVETGRSGETDSTAHSILEGRLALTGQMLDLNDIPTELDQEGVDALKGQIAAFESKIQELHKERRRLHKKIRDSQHVVNISSIDKKSLEADKHELSAKLMMLEASPRSSSRGGGSSSGNASPRGVMRDVDVMKAELEGKLRAAEIDIDLIRRELQNSNGHIENNEAVSSSLGKLIREAEEAYKALSATLSSSQDSTEPSTKAQRSSTNDGKKSSREKRSNAGAVDDELAPLMHEIKTLIIAKDFLGIIISRLADDTTIDAKHQLQAAEDVLEGLVAEKAKLEMKISGLEMSRTAVEMRLETNMDKIKLLSAQQSEDQGKLFKALAHIHEIEEARAKVVDETKKSDEALKDVREHIQALEASLQDKKEELNVLVSAWSQLKKLKVEKEEFSQSTGHLDASQSVLETRLEECKADAFKFQSELSLSSKIIGGLELSNQRVENQKRQVEKQLSTMVARRSVIEKSLAGIEDALKSAERDNESLPFQLDECQNDLAESKVQLEHYAKLVAGKMAEIGRLKQLVKRQEQEGGLDFSVGLEYEIELQTAEKEISRLQSEVKRLRKKKAWANSTVTMLKSQSTTALKSVEDTLKELTDVEEKRGSVKLRYEQLLSLFSSIEDKHATMKEKLRRVGDTSGGLTQMASLGIKKRSPHKLLVEQSPRDIASPIATHRDVKSLHAVSPAPNVLDEVPAPSPKALGLQSTSKGITKLVGGPKDEIAKEPYIRSIQCVYKSKTAFFLIRRPYHLRGPENVLFQEASPLDAGVYSETANLKDPTTIDIIAKIKHDGSRFLLSGRSTVRYRGKDGSWENTGDTDSLDTPLGWVAYTNQKGKRDHYSLDEVLEDARVYRQHYCESFILQSRHPMDKITYFFHRVKLEILFRTCFSETQSFLLSNTVLFVAMLVVTLSMLISAVSK